MIVLSRGAIRRFRLVTRQDIPAGQPHGPSPPVRLLADGTGVMLTAHLGCLVVGLRLDGIESGGSGSLIIPLSELLRFEVGGARQAVTFEAISAERGLARWVDHEQPGSEEFALADDDPIWPDEPEHLISLSPAFFGALREAGRTASLEANEQVANEMHLPGESGLIDRIDGDQASARGGFTFRFDVNVPLALLPICGPKRPRNVRGMGIGLSDNWLCVFLGPWRFWLMAEH